MHTIYFDLDGTLTDPKPGITRSIQYALKTLGQAVPTEDELTWCIGPPLHASLKKLTGTDELADRALLLYRERFADVGLFENEAYGGIEGTLSALAATSPRMFVATSKPRVFAERIIDHFGLRRYFERVFGSELDGTRVDKGDLLAYALDEAKVDPRSAVMIGDRSHDVVGARKNGMTAIGVLYGYGSEDELRDAGAHHICAAHPELLDRYATLAA
ncbi:HAD family hydrolase [Bradyrhizobium manausense]|uniref:HAD family hydrolase n=1 Tax=Bradyrhizobium TaxID=374 RepID=UPI001BA7BCB9|nr:MULTISPECIES: HAD family hydrolase [Bradyrhizobium]MBR0831192.1 HAD family hydrolase [Bradyrhizobium manausense]UVO32667.1 HAD family hydrolase [Bradyrhizobium arachidis]